MERKEIFIFRRYPKKDELRDPHVLCSARRGDISTSELMHEGMRYVKTNKVVDVRK